MLRGDVRRKQIKEADVMNVVERRGRPEVHLNLALTFVWGGDPIAVKSEDRDQLEIELKQWAARLKHGKIKGSDIQRVMSEFAHVVQENMRASGALKGGE